MSSYGRNFDFLVTPEPYMRQGRYILDVACPIGAPVIVTSDDPSELRTGARTVELATGAQAPPLPGQGGIGIYEHLELNGYDPVLTRYSDRDEIPTGKMLQVVRGEGVKVLLRNTNDRRFLHSRDYDGRVFVAGLGATPTLAEGDFLTPGAGDDTSGYWAETADADLAWLVVELVNPDRGEAEARLMF